MVRLKRDSLPKGGFAGVREHRLIKDPRLFGPGANQDGSWSGMGNLVYLADAQFIPHGETLMHNHHEIDVISVMVDGRIAHQGSLGHGQDLNHNEIQVQRAGSEGFAHNEVNPDDAWNRMIQLWVLPEQPGQSADYEIFQSKPGNLTRIYGGNASVENRFPAKTRIDVALLNSGQDIDVKGSCLAYLTRGSGIANGELIEDGDLIRADDLQFKAAGKVQLIVMHTEYGDHQ